MRIYFNVTTQEDKVKVRINESLVEERIKKQGIFYLAYNGNFDGLECLSLYKSKQLIEMSFDILKNDLGITTPYVHSNEALKGLMLIGLISLLLRMRILKILKDAKMNEDFSFERVILELSKLKAIRYDNGEIMFNERTKKQNILLKLFDAVPKL